MVAVWRAFVAAVRFLTRVPLPGAPTRGDELAGAVRFFPLIGALVGALVGAVYAWAFEIWGPLLAACLALLAGVLSTGAFHEDAVADSFDGLGGGFTTERVLEILKDSRIGSYGSVALILLLLTRFSVLVSVPVGEALPMVVVAMATGRWTAAPLLRFAPAAREGLARDIQGMGSTATFALATAMWLAVLGAVAWHTQAWLPWLAIPTACVCSALWGGYLVRRLGGHTGDLLGAGNQLVEVAVYFAWIAIAGSHL